MEAWMKPHHELFFNFDFVPNIDSVNGSSRTFITGEDSSAHLVVFLLALLILRSFCARFIHRSFPNQGQSEKQVKNGITQLPSLPLIGPLHIAVQYMNDLPKLLDKWMLEYGHSAWKAKAFGKTFVLLNNAPMIQKLISSTDPTHLEKPSFIYQKILMGVAKQGLITSGTNVWNNHRPVIGKAFSYEFLKSYLQTFNSYAEALIKDLDKIAEKPESGYIGSLLHIHSLGMILNIVTGIDSFSVEESSSFHRNFERYKAIVSYRFRNPWLIPEFIWKLHPYGREVEGVLANIESSIKTCLQRYKIVRQNGANTNSQNEANTDNESLRRKCVLDVMVEDGFSDDEIFSEVISLVIAGHESISLSVTFLLFNLALNPEWQKNCQDEVDKVFQEMNPNTGSLSMDALSDLKYVERCIKETLRLLPALPIISRELGSPLKLDDKTVLNPGTLVFVSPWMLHRNPDYYPNPNTFDPERFLPENCRGRSTYAYQPFSAGQRNCVGWKMAMIEMKVLAAFILHNFEVTTTDRLEDIRFQYNLTILPDKELNFKLRKRPHDN